MEKLSLLGAALMLALSGIRAESDRGLAEVFSVASGPEPGSVHGMKEPQAYLFEDAGEIPNHRELPLLIYPGAGSGDPKVVEALFERNGWRPAWRWSVFPYPHYHSTAHEVLGIYRGWAKIRLGHTTGRVFMVKAGDVIVIPAGVGHQNLESSEDFHVVGGYPPGQKADQMRGLPGERPAADENMKKVPLPESDPVFGPEGPLRRLWKNPAEEPPEPKKNHRGL